MIRLQPKDMPDQEEENKKANQSVIENAVFFFLTIAVIRAGEHIKPETIPQDRTQDSRDK